MYDGDDVKLAGLTVGEVTAVDVIDGRARVRFEVDEEVRLPTDTTVAVRWRNLVGQRFLGLEPGTADALLAEGDEVDRAADAVDLGQLVNQLVPLTRSVSPDQVKEKLTSLLEAFDGNEDRSEEHTSELQSLMRI